MTMTMTMTVCGWGVYCLCRTLSDSVAESLDELYS
jgi:hypothetical protein